MKSSALQHLQTSAL